MTGPPPARAPWGSPGRWPADETWVWRRMLEGTAAGIALFDTEMRYVWVNAALARINGTPAADHAGRAIADIVPGVDAREELMYQVLADGVAREAVTSGQTRADSPHTRRYWQGSYHRIEDDSGKVLGLGVVVVEISDAHETQRELERARERLLLLDAAAVRIGSTLEMERTCQELSDLLVEVLADAAGVEVLAMEGGEGHAPPPRGTVRLRRVAIAARPHLREKVRVFGAPGTYVDHQPGSSVPRCLATGRAVVQNLPRDEEMSRAAPQATRVAQYRAAGLHSAVIVPLAARGDQIGIVTLVRADESPPFDDEDVTVAQALVDRAAISLDNARRYSREHGIAVELQRALLAGHTSPLPRIEVAGRYQPSGATALVGGDWFDTLALPGGAALLVIGDVMGHGVDAAVDMSNYRAMLRVLAARGDRPGRVLRRMDEMLSTMGVERPATCMLGVADPVRGAVWFANAGHLPPAVIGPDGRVSLVKVPPGPPLGADLHGSYRTVRVPWRPGETLLLYTDGLVERRGEDIDTSLARLAGLTLPQPSGPLDVTLAEIVRRLAPPAAEDDVAVMVARARPSAGSPHIPDAPGAPDGGRSA